MTTNTKKYNGWANYETWRVNLEIIDDMTEVILESAVFEDKNVDAYDAGQCAKEFVDIMFEEAFDDATEIQNLFSGYADWFLRDVNWTEIGEALIETRDDIAANS